MKAGWKEVRLGDCITDMASGPFGSSLTTACFVGSGCPVLEGSNLKGFKVADEFVKYVTREKALSLKRCLAHRNDVVVTIRGTLGQIAYVPEDSKYEAYLCCQSQFRVTFDGSLINVPYIVYWFHSREGQEKLLSFSAQVGVPALSQPLKNFPKISLRLPPLSTQRRIAAVLGALDDKIELNRKMNANLEAQAQALFKSWFVDFTPWGGKMPKEWKMGCVGDIASVNPTRSLKKNEIAICVEMADLSTNCSYPDRVNVKSYNGGMKFKNGDTLMARITPCLENGKAAFVNFLAEGEIGFGSTEYITLCSKTEAPDELFYFLVRDPDFVRYATLHMVGSSGRQRVSGAEIAAYALPIATEEFYREIKPILATTMRMIAANAAESRKLAEIRDALLPKLMSGEVEVG